MQWRGSRGAGQKPLVGRVPSHGAAADHLVREGTEKVGRDSGVDDMTTRALEEGMTHG